MNEDTYKLSVEIRKAAVEEYLKSLDKGVETSKWKLIRLIEDAPRWNWEHNLPKIVEAVEDLKDAMELHDAIGYEHLWKIVEKD